MFTAWGNFQVLDFISSEISLLMKPAFYIDLACYKHLAPTEPFHFLRYETTVNRLQGKKKRLGDT